MNMVCWEGSLVLNPLRKQWWFTIHVQTTRVKFHCGRAGLGCSRTRVDTSYFTCIIGMIYAVLPFLAGRSKQSTMTVLWVSSGWWLWTQVFTPSCHIPKVVAVKSVHSMRTLHMEKIKDVVVQSVYFVGRPRQSGHRNLFVFLVEVQIAILKQKGIVRCSVGGNTYLVIVTVITETVGLKWCHVWSAEQGLWWVMGIIPYKTTVTMITTMHNISKIP